MAKVSRTKSGQSTNELYKPSWIFWETLQFLRPVMQPGKSKDNLQSHPDEDPFSESENTVVLQKKVAKKSKEEKKQDFFKHVLMFSRSPI